MPRRSYLIVLLAGVLFSIGVRSRAEPPQAGRSADAGGASRFRVVIWYDRSRPFDTFRYRAYDVAKGEYTKAVDDWMALMERAYPGYTVAIRNVEATEADAAEKVAAAVEDEKLARARLILESHSIGASRRNFTYGSGYHGLSWSPATTAPKRNPSPFDHGIPGSFAPLARAPGRFPNLPLSQPHALPTTASVRNCSTTLPVWNHYFTIVVRSDDLSGETRLTGIP